MADEFENPQEELSRVVRVIRQYEGILRTASDPYLQDRARTKLAALRRRREHLERTFELDGDALEDSLSKRPEPAPEGPYLALARSLCGVDENVHDAEVAALDTYIGCFGREFLVLLSERQLKLDFKHSLDRDNFYHRFQSVVRKMGDYKGDLAHLTAEETRSDLQHDIQRRSFKMRRGVVVEASRFFADVATFALELIEDVETDGYKCLNGGQTVRFDRVEGRRHLEGIVVLDALKQIRAYSMEVVEFLNVPDFESQES
jgi:hypothetical protein